jgi:acetyltransferase-like isoleucine patch superfamily enzyme
MSHSAIIFEDSGMTASGSSLVPDSTHGTDPESAQGIVAPERVSWTRVSRLARSEVVRFQPRKAVSLLLAMLLPRETFNYLRTLLVRLAGVRVGRRTRFLGPLKLTGQCGAALLSIGADCVIGGPLYVDLGESVEIGDRVHIGHHVLLHTVDHKIGPEWERCGPHIYAPIEIRDGSWIGSMVTILPGVKIGPGSVVAAGALVNRDVLPNTLVAGVPAHKIRDLPAEEPDEAARLPDTTSSGS